MMGNDIECHNVFVANYPETFVLHYSIELLATNIIIYV